MLYKSQGPLDPAAAGEGWEMVSHHQHALHGLENLIAIDFGFSNRRLVRIFIGSSNDGYLTLHRVRLDGWLFRPLSNCLQAAHEFMAGKAHVLSLF